MCFAIWSQEASTTVVDEAAIARFRGSSDNILWRCAFRRDTHHPMNPAGDRAWSENEVSRLDNRSI
jgi:hypothetical protein